MGAAELRNELIAVLSAEETILGIGQTGTLDAVLIPGKSDIDLFVLCGRIPSEEERRNLYRRIRKERFELSMTVCSGGRWGTGDILNAGGIDVMPMYFTLAETRGYLERLLSGKGLEKEGRFYPVGRLASVSSLRILWERDGAWSALKDRVNRKPEAFFRQWYESELGQVLDEEDLGRTELRGEVLFFHQVLENALDHLLQALYAVNFRYFPSRKRTLSDLEGFEQKPADCAARLLRLIGEGSRQEGLTAAMEELRRLTAEVGALGDRAFGLRRE